MYEKSYNENLEKLYNFSKKRARARAARVLQKDVHFRAQKKCITLYWLGVNFPGSILDLGHRDFFR